MTLPPSPALPGLPVVISATAVSNSEIDVTVTYTGPPAAATYTFSFSTNPGGPYSTATQVSATYRHTGLAPNTKVYYFANVTTAENPVRTSQNSPQVSSTTLQNAVAAATPTFSKPSGTYPTPIPFTLSCTTPGASIYYTLTFAVGSGTTPVIGQSGTVLYTGSINDAFVGPLVVNAIAAAPGFAQSAVGTVTYTATAAPTFSPVAGTYASGQAVAISYSTPGAAIYYTSDSSTPAVVVTTPVLLPNYTDLYGNTYVAGTSGTVNGQTGSAPKNLPVNTVWMLSENNNPAQGNGFFLPNTWNAGAYTGFTPINAGSQSQLSVAATGTSPSSTMQWEGGTMGALMLGSDLSTSTNRPQFTPQINFTNTPGSGPVLFTGPSVTLTNSMTMQCPTFVGSGSPQTTANSPYIHVNLGLVGPGLIGGQAWELDINICLTQGAGAPSDISKSYVAQGSANAYLFLVPVNAASASPYITFTSGNYSNGTFPNQTFAWSISAAQFQNILNYMAAQGWGANPAFPSGLTPGQFTLNQSHVNAEMPNISTISLGWSMSQWDMQVYTPQGTTQLYTTPVTLSSSKTLEAVALVNQSGGYAQSAVGTAAYIVGASSVQPFPRTTVQASDGAQLPGPSTYNGLAQYSMITLGGPFPSAVGGSKPTRDQIVTGLKGQTKTGKNFVLPLVGQYEDLPNTTANRSIDNFPELTTATNNNNWWVWVSGSSGTQALDGGGGYNLRTPCHGGGAGGVAAIAVDPATGLWPYEFCIKAMRDRYIVGGGLATSTTFSQMGSAQLDYLFVDNMSAYIRIAGDWERKGSTQGSGQSTPASTAAKLFAGQADVANKFRALDSTRKIVGNTAWWSGLQYGLDGSPMAGKFDYPMQQFFSGRGIESQLQYRGFATSMAWYQSIIASSANGSCILTAQYKPGDYQYMRRDYCFMLMNNGYLQSAVGSNGNLDLVDGSNPSTWPVCDEIWGGALGLGGFLGAPDATAQGAAQTAAWQGNVWRRDYANGIVLLNSGTSSQAVNLGGTYYHLRTNTGQAINNAASATSVTLGTFSYNTANSDFPAGNTFTCGDACILMKNPT